jgi:hypothetical protein
MNHGARRRPQDHAPQNPRSSAFKPFNSLAGVVAGLVSNHAIIAMFSWNILSTLEFVPTLSPTLLSRHRAQSVNIALTECAEIAFIRDRLRYT